MNCFELPTISFCLLNYSDIIIKSEKKIINDLYKYGLLDKFNMRKLDTKKAFYHHIIHDLCESVSSVKTNNKIIVYKNLDCISLELLHYTTRLQLVNFLNTLTRKIERLLPVKIYNGDEDYDTFVDRCKSGHGELKSRANLIDDYMKKQSNKRFDFASIKSFVRRYELTYLSEQYFQNIKVKNLVFL